MSTKEAKQMDKALFDFYGKPSIGQALPLAIQHRSLLREWPEFHRKIP